MYIMLTKKGHTKEVSRLLSIKFGRDVAGVILSFYVYEESRDLSYLMSMCVDKRCVQVEIENELDSTTIRGYFHRDIKLFINFSTSGSDFFVLKLSKSIILVRRFFVI